MTHARLYSTKIISVHSFLRITRRAALVARIRLDIAHWPAKLDDRRENSIELDQPVPDWKIRTSSSFSNRWQLELNENEFEKRKAYFQDQSVDRLFLVTFQFCIYSIHVIPFELLTSELITLLLIRAREK